MKYRGHRIIKIASSSFIFLFLILSSNFSFAQNVGINVTGAAPDSSAILDVSTDGMNPKKGILIPRMTTTERDNIPAPIPESLLIFNTTTHCFEAYSTVDNIWESIGCLNQGGGSSTAPFACGDSIQDVDGNKYGTVQIGSQCWTSNNLNTTHFNDGSTIHQEQDAVTWNDYTQPAYCWYNNDPSNGNTYGGLYNWFVIDHGAVCPTGWHVPTDGEWCQMENAVEVNVDASCSSWGWRGTVLGTHLKSNTWDGDNTSGFSGLPSGYRWGGTNNANKGVFSEIGNMTQIWTASSDGTLNGYNYPTAIKRNLNTGNAGVFRQRVAKQNGLPIRCVKD